MAPDSGANAAEYAIDSRSWPPSNSTACASAQQKTRRI